MGSIGFSKAVARLLSAFLRGQRCAAGLFILVHCRALHVFRGEHREPGGLSAVVPTIVSLVPRGEPAINQIRDADEVTAVTKEAFPREPTRHRYHGTMRGNVLRGPALNYCKDT